MADAIGVQRKWIQKAGTYKEHFDICLSKKSKALSLGAIAITRREYVEIVNQRKATGLPITPIKEDQ